MRKKHEHQQQNMRTCHSGLDVSAYLLLYGISLYHVVDEDLNKLDIPEKDQITIKKVGVVK